MFQPYLLPPEGLGQPGRIASGDWAGGMDDSRVGGHQGAWAGDSMGGKCKSDGGTVWGAGYPGGRSPFECLGERWEGGRYLGCWGGWVAWLQ